jgi:autotransporter-associated beta strand protein
MKNSAFQNHQRAFAMHPRTIVRSSQRLAVSGLLALATACLCTTPVHAVNKTWLGTFGPSWSDGDNWSPVGAPATTGDVLIWGSTSTGNLTSTNDISGLATALTFNTNIPGSVSLSGNAITLSGNVSGAFTGTVTIDLDLSMSAGRTIGLTGANSQLFLNGVISGGASDVLTLSSGGLTSLTYLNGANTFGGVARVTRGTVLINTLANSGTPQSLGTGTAVDFGFGSSATTGNIIYTGSTAVSTNKQWNLGQNSSDVNRVHNGGFFNDGGGAVTWQGTQVLQTSTVTARTFTLGGSNTDDNTWATAIQNNNTANGGTVSLTKTGLGKWILGGTNTYSGATSVEQGLLLVDGSTAAGSAVSVASAAVFGGSGTVNGDLTLDSGALFTFDPNSTLTVGGTFALDPLFGVASLRNTSGGSIDWGAIAQNTYTLMNTSFAFNAGTISDFGESNAVPVGSGKTAYFEQGTGSLQLVVVPEPATLAVVGMGLGLAGLGWRHHRRRSNRMVRVRSRTRPSAESL